MAESTTIPNGKVLETERGEHFRAVHAGPWDHLTDYFYEHPKAGFAVPGKLFLKGALELNGLEISLNCMPPGAAMPFLHRHQQNDELYLIVKGRGEIQVDGQVIPVEEGSVVTVDPEGARAWRNVGTEPLHYVVIQTRRQSQVEGTVLDGLAVPGRPRWPRTDR